MKNLKKRILTVLLLVCMLALQILPLAASAGSALVYPDFGAEVIDFAENVQTIGEDLFVEGLKFSERMFTGADPVAGYTVQLKTDSWYYIEFTPYTFNEDLTNVNSVNEYYVYRAEGDFDIYKPVYYYDPTTFNMLFYTGTKGPIFIHIASPDELHADVFNAFTLKQVKSYDTYYDISKTNFYTDMAYLFPDIDLSERNRAGTSEDYFEILGVYEEFTDEAGRDLYLYVFSPRKSTILSGSFEYMGYTATLEPVYSPGAWYTDSRYFKFKVGGWGYQHPLDEAGNEDTSKRKYSIGNVTFHYENGTSKTFINDAAFIFTDVQPVTYGLNTQSTATEKTVEGYQNSTIDLEIGYTFYRTDTSSAGANYHNQVDSIYFNVPNYLLESYGELVNVELKFRRVRTQPIIVVDDADVYSALSEFTLNRKVLSSINNSLPSFGVITARNFAEGVNHTRYLYAFNIPETEQNGISYYQNHITNNLNQLYWVFKVKDASETLSSSSTVSNSEIVEWGTKKYPCVSYLENYVEGAEGVYNANLFEVIDGYTVLNTETLNLKAESYGSTHVFFKNWAAFGFAYALEYSNIDSSDLGVIETLVPILDKSQIIGGADNLLFYEGDQDQLWNFFTKNSDDTLFLCRFNVSQYYEDAIEGSYKGGRFDGYIAQVDHYLDMHVLSCSFENELEGRTTFKVNGNHIDCVSKVTNEKDPEDLNKEAAKKLRTDFLSNDFVKLNVILGIIGLLVGIIILGIYVMPYVGPFIREFVNSFTSLFTKKDKRGTSVTIIQSTSDFKTKKQKQKKKVRKIK